MSGEKSRIQTMHVCVCVCSYIVLHIYKHTHTKNSNRYIYHCLLNGAVGNPLLNGLKVPVWFGVSPPHMGFLHNCGSACTNSTNCRLCRTIVFTTGGKKKSLYKWNLAVQIMLFKGQLYIE